MIRFYPDSTLVQLEFEQIKMQLANFCQTDYARKKAENLRVHTREEYIRLELDQTAEFLEILNAGIYFPYDYVLNLQKQLKLLTISNAVLEQEDFIAFRKLAENTEKIFRWFDNERRESYPSLSMVISNSYYEKAIKKYIDEVFDEGGLLKDNASEELARIRAELYRKRNELRRVFDRYIQKLAKAGYVADIQESFLNGRRVVAVLAEYKRQVKGIIHGESDTRKTSFIEPEETIELNNEVFLLEDMERREIYKILRELTSKLSGFSALLEQWHNNLGEFDFIRAKAKFAKDINAARPKLRNVSHIHLIQAYHPLLLLYNKRAGKPTYPVSLTLDKNNRILLISGPNAGGKTVTLKTVGLLQLMIQSGLLIPVHPDSELGIFKQFMIHIGDTQSLEFELSTYSSHLINMKYFIEHANGRTLFFIDELGSGSDPNLGGAFAEVILEELIKKHAYGIVTTHYLNLKIMANKTPGIFNGAMAFDEVHLQPMYKLIIGKPGSSYTFSIAERIGLAPELIERARNLVDKGHFRLDKLLNQTEKDLQQIEKEKKELRKMVKENEKLRQELDALIKKEKHAQQIELLKHQNKVTEERLKELKDLERMVKQLISDWKRAENQEDKSAVIRQMNILLSGQKKVQAQTKAADKIKKDYKIIQEEIKPGQMVLMKKNHKVGEVSEIRGKKAIVKIGLIPITVAIEDLVAVESVKETQSPE